MFTPFTPVPPPPQIVYLKNPTPALIKALGKTEKDLTADDFGRDWKWLEIPNIPEGVEIHYGDEDTFLASERNKVSSVKKKIIKPKIIPKIKPQKKVAKKKAVTPKKKKILVLTDEESARLFGFKKKEFRMKFSKRINEHFEKIRSVSHVVLDELARTKGKGFQRPIIDRGKHLKVVFADLSPLEVQEFAEISLYVFHDCEVDAVVPLEHLSPKVCLEAIA